MTSNAVLLRTQSNGNVRGEPRCKSHINESAHPLKQRARMIGIESSV